MAKHLVALTVLAIGLASGCSPEDSTPSPQPAPVSAAPGQSAVAEESFADSLIQVGGPPGYAGSTACRECHPEQFDSWHRTFHRTMTQFATPQAVQASFHDVVLTNDGTRFRLSQQGEALQVRMEQIGSTSDSGEPPPSVDTRISLVTGSHHMQVFWVPGGDGNIQVGFPFTWLIPEKRWVPRNATFIRPPSLAHQAEVWNVTCSRCHATGVEPRVNSAERRMDSRVADLGIACEACHGPAGRHVMARTAAGPKAPKPDAATLRQEIVQPEKLDAARASEICGFCHSMKWIDRGEAARPEGFHYRPGDKLEASTPLIQPRQVAAVPGLQEFLARNPNLLADYFWSDGMGRVSGREFNGLAESPCFQGGKFSCLSCHSLHTSDPDDLLAKSRTGNSACTQCHEGFRAPAAVQRHTHHLPESSGSECYNCHMPHTTYGVLTAIRSHQISNPRVADQRATGRPNACNLCHLDRTLGWTAEHLTAWYRQPVAELDHQSATVAESVRLALAGDAGLRALMAWHLGWAPARQASGSDWIAPILGQLLDDPYAAVRCLADRSLRATSTFVPTGYDFVLVPPQREPAAGQVWTAWSQHLSGLKPPPQLPPAVLVEPGPLARMNELLGPLAAAQDQRPIRLRE